LVLGVAGFAAGFDDVLAGGFTSLVGEVLEEPASCVGDVLDVIFNNRCEKFVDVHFSGTHDFYSSDVEDAGVGVDGSGDDTDDFGLAGDYTEVGLADSDEFGFSGVVGGIWEDPDDRSSCGGVGGGAEDPVDEVGAAGFVEVGYAQDRAFSLIGDLVDRGEGLTN
jgi:hypothetical protein